MTNKLPKNHYSIAMLLVPGFNSLAASAFIDPLRTANYIQGEVIYSWDWVGINSMPVRSSNGLVSLTSTSIAEKQTQFDYVVVNASWAPEKSNNDFLKEWLRRQANKACTMIGIDTGCFLLGYAGLLDSYRVTVHYEHIAAFKELFPKALVSEALYTQDRDRFSCCGGHAATDLGLEIVRAHNGVDLANAAARYIFHERLRTQAETQLSCHLEPVGYAVPTGVREAILLMERNLEEPLSLSEIADLTGVSQRHMERLFKQYTGVSPIKYYIDVRLDRARGLLTQTDMAVVEVAAACGFNSSENLSRAYRKRFNLSPTKDRREGRIPFHFRSFPSHAGLHE